MSIGFAQEQDGKKGEETGKGPPLPPDIAERVREGMKGVQVKVIRVQGGSVFFTDTKPDGTVKNIEHKVSTTGVTKMMGDRLKLGIGSKEASSLPLEHEPAQTSSDLQRVKDTDPALPTVQNDHSHDGKPSPSTEDAAEGADEVEPRRLTMDELVVLVKSSMGLVCTYIQIGLRQIFEECYNVPRDLGTWGGITIAEHVTSRERSTLQSIIQTYRDHYATQLGFRSYQDLLEALAGRDSAIAYRITERLFMMGHRSGTQRYDLEIIKGFLLPIIEELEKGKSLEQAIDTCHI